MEWLIYGVNCVDMETERETLMANAPYWSFIGKTLLLVPPRLQEYFTRSHVQAPTDSDCNCRVGVCASIELLLKPALSKLLSF